MDIFPIGTVAGSSSSGTIDSISYSQFEPNNGAKSYKIFNNLITSFQSQTILTRKKTDPFLMLEYSYNNIFAREFRQIEHFISKKEEALNSFYVIDWYRGITPSSIANPSGDWLVSIDDTRLFSTVANQKANKAIIWDGVNWKEGSIITIVANTSVTVDVDTNNYGGLSLANAQAGGIIYPLYQCYFIPKVLDDFQTGEFIPKISVNNSEDGGFISSGNISFVSRYKV